MEKEKKGLNISAKSFIVAIAVIFALMVATYVLTFIIPSGEYGLKPDGSINPEVFNYVETNFPFWKWLLSPVLVLGAEGNGTVIAVLAFLLIIGGVFNCLDKCNFLKYMLGRIIAKFGKKRYTLLFIVTLFFMCMGSFVGSFEECVPMVPIVIALAVALGWDEVTGLGMSIVAVGCGFATGILNPFTLGVAQSLAGLPMFSGIWLRLVSGVLIYGVLVLFVYLHAKHVEKPVEEVSVEGAVETDAKMNKALICFASILGGSILLVLSSTFLTFLQDYTMIIIVVAFLLSGTTASLVSGMKVKSFLKVFLDGVVSILPAVIMILMASSIKYILTEAKILDTLLYKAVGVASGMNPVFVILFMYLIALVLNFFVSSGSAKAILLIPLLIPMAQMFGVSSQLTILAYVYGDGFSNVLYPTNAVLLISLGLANVSYGKYFKWIWKLQLALLVLTCGLLIFGQLIGY